MLGKEEEDNDWCIVQWHNGDALVRRKSDWEAYSKHNQHKWEYIAQGLTTEQAKNYSKLFKEN